MVESQRTQITQRYALCPSLMSAVTPKPNILFILANDRQHHHEANDLEGRS